MKWGNHNEQAAEQMNAIFTKIFKGKSLLVMLALASLILIAGANSKFV